MSDINMTPFVDVMLVLLIVFMITAPLLTVGVPVDLPEADAPTLNEPEEPLVVTVGAEGTIYVQETEVTLDRLIPLLLAVTDRNRDLRVYVRGDRSLSYGRIMEVMGHIAGAGFTRVALIADLPKVEAGQSAERRGQ